MVRLTRKPIRNYQHFLESLETRTLLSVSTTEFAAIKTQYADLNLGNYGDYNIIEITANNLSDEALRFAISEAATTAKSDLIVIRTTTSQNTITLDGSELLIDINAEQYGSLTIVSLGNVPLTIDANHESRIFNIAETTNVALAGLTITNGRFGETISNEDYWNNEEYYDNYFVHNGGGGGIYNAGTLFVTKSTVTKNTVNSCFYDEEYDEEWSRDDGIGGGIYNVGTLTLTHSAVTKNTTGDGAGIYNLAGTVTLENSTVSENIATGNYSVRVTGVPTYTESTLTANTRGWGGGGIFNLGGTLILTDSAVTENTAGSHGGGIFNIGGSLTLTNSTISENTAGITHGYEYYDDGDHYYTYSGSAFGGGIYNISGSLTLTNTTVTKNTATGNGYDDIDIRIVGGGGGIYNLNGTLTLTNSTVSENTAGIAYDTYDDYTDVEIRNSSGGGICNILGTLTLTNTTITKNTATGGEYYGGGGICNLGGTVTVANSNITENAAGYDDYYGNGGGIYSASYEYNYYDYDIEEYYYSGWFPATMTITGSTIAENTAKDGGGIYNSGGQEYYYYGDDFSEEDLLSMMTITDSIIAGNTATGWHDSDFNSGLGGGIANWGIYYDHSEDICYTLGFLTVTNSIITGNTAGWGGGGILNYAECMVTNSIIMDNTTDGNGGGIYLNGDGLRVVNSTIVANTAEEEGGGIYCGGSMTLANTIIVGNSSDVFFYEHDGYDESNYVHGYNNLTTFTGWENTDGNNIVYDSDKQLFVNAATGNYRIVADSQATDKGNNALIPTGITTDLAGNARIHNDIVDIGAYEYGSTPSTTQLSAPTNLTATSKNANTITLNWTATPNATGYIIQYATNSTFTDTQTKTATSTTTDITNLTTNTTYYFRIIATGTGTYTDSNPSTPATAVPTAPLVPAADPVKTTGIKSNASISTITLTWTNNDKNAEYVIVCTSHTGIAPKTVTGNSVTFEGLQPGTAYKFTVVAKNADGKETAAVKASAKTQKFTAVKMGKATSSLGAVTLNWVASPFAETTGYEVYRVDAKTKAETLVWQGNATTATISEDIAPSTKYTFVVRAVSSTLNIQSANAKASAKTQKFIAVKKSKIKPTSTPTSITLTWTASPLSETTGYEVYRIIGKTEELVWQGNTTTATIDELDADTKYTFVVRAVSSTSNIKSANMKISAKTAK